MNSKLRFIISLLSTILFILLASSLTAQNLEESTGPTLLSGPDFSQLTASSVTISWETLEPSNGFVAFGVDSSLPWVACSLEMKKNHAVNIDSLLPGTRYLAIIGAFDVDGNGPTLSEVVPFTTHEEEILREDSTGAGFFVLPGDTVIDVGTSLQFTAYYKFPNGTTVDTLAEWSLRGKSIGSITENGMLHTLTPGFAHVKATLGDKVVATKVTAIDTSVDDSGVNTVSIGGVLPNGKLQHPKTISEGSTYKLHGFPSPLNMLNGGFIYFPSGCLDEDILIHINLPKCAKTLGDSVDFDHGIVTGVQFDVFVNDSLVHPYYFKKPLIVSLPIRKGVLKKLNIDPVNLGMFFMNDDLFDGAGINFTVVDSSVERVFSLVAHFSTLIVKEKEASVISGIETVGVAEPANAFELLQNYPNPFNPETSIQFTLSRAANVNLTIYNIAGQKVRTLLDETLNAGSNAAVWNGKNEAGENVSSGLYYYRLRVQNQIAVKKMMLLH